MISRPVRILVGHDAERGVVIDDGRGIDQAAVDVAGQRRLGESRTDARGNVRHGHGVIEVLLRAVGQGYYGHGRMLPEVLRVGLALVFYKLLI